MSRKRLSMRKVNEVLRLKWSCGLSKREIAKSCSISRSTVSEYLRRADEAGISWPLPEGLSEGDLDRLLFPPPPSIPAEERAKPDWLEIHQEKKRKGVTMFLLWQEYKERHPDGFQYSAFCQKYQTWSGKLDLVMRQDHRAGEKMFVDYAGQTMPVVDPKTGEIRHAQIFVAVLGASNYTYAEATWTQALPDWISSHSRAFAFFGGVPEIVVPDNLKSGVTKSCKYEPDINPTYQDMATHYGCAVIPARVRRPKDKAKVEVAVQVVERWILARLRNNKFFSLSELNAAISKLIAQLNDRQFKKLPGSRKSLFETMDKPALRALPSEPYVYAEWKKARVNIDYHIEVKGLFYSVPYQLVKHEVEARVTKNTVEVFYRGQRVASHPRFIPGLRYITNPEHMPKAHQKFAEWTPQRLIRWASQNGPSTAKLIESVLSSRHHPQQGFRSCLGIMRLGKDYGEERLEAACSRALTFGGLSFKSIQAILKRGLDQHPLPERQEEPEPLNHVNIRGPHYYQPAEGDSSC